MARFYADVQGNRGEGTRMGTPQSGIAGHIRGWDTGVSVRIHAEGDHDVVRVYRTRGSNRSGDVLLAEWIDNKTATFGSKKAP